MKKFSARQKAAAAAAILALTGGLTAASWTSHATVSTNVTMASAVLVNGASSYDASSLLAHMAPGDTVTIPLTLTSPGTGTRTVSYSLAGLSDPNANYIDWTIGGDGYVGIKNLGYTDTDKPVMNSMGSAQLTFAAGSQANLTLTISIDPAAPTSMEGASYNGAVFTFSAV